MKACARFGSGRRAPAAATEAATLAAVVVELAAGGALGRSAVGAGHVHSLLAAVIGGPAGPGGREGGSRCECVQRVRPGP